MSSQTNQLDDVFLRVKPYQKQIIFNMALHKSGIIANQLMWFKPLGQCTILLKLLKDFF